MPHVLASVLWTAHGGEETLDFILTPTSDSGLALSLPCFCPWLGFILTPISDRCFSFILTPFSDCGLALNTKFKYRIASCVLNKLPEFSTHVLNLVLKF